ncbi:MAG: hypothetical protein ACOCUY_01450 [Verrucomicrobiota bacterium]
MEAMVSVIMPTNIKWLSPMLSARRLALAAALLLIAWVIAALVRTPEPEVIKISLQPDGEMHVGQTAECTLQLQTPWFAPPQIGEINTPDSVQIARTPQRSFSGLTPTSWRWTYRILIQPLETGDFNPGSVEFIIQAPRQKEATSVTVQLPQLVVTPRPEDEVESVTIADPLAQAKADSDLRRMLPYILGAAAALVIAVALLAFLWHRQRVRSPEAEWGPLPHEQALIKLQKLEARLPMEPNPFYVELTDILRSYAEQRFDIRAAEQTTPEFLRSIARNPDIQTEHRQALETCMTAADKIKFARGQASLDEIRQSLEQARSLIADTAPRQAENQDQQPHD